jgi:mRNA interferase RelE/StbE
MKVAFKAPFLKAIQKIRDKQLKSDIANIIEDVEFAPDIRSISELKKLKGYKDYYRIKIGIYRIGLKINDDTVFFVDIDHRKDVYKHFP